jgi:hypothetical protein
MMQSLRSNEARVRDDGNSQQSQLSLRRMFHFSKKRVLPNREQFKSIETLDTVLNENGDGSTSSCRSQNSAATSSFVDVDKALGKTIDDVESHVCTAPTISSCLKISTQEQSVGQEYRGSAVSFDVDEIDGESKSSLEWPFASRGSSVQFDSISVHVHTVTLGDNPSVSMGPPISIEWQAMETFTVSVNEYEETKPISRERQEMLIPVCVRESMLRDVGFGRSDMVSATKTAHQIQVSRRKSEQDGALANSVKQMFRFIGPVGRKSSNNDSTVR